MKRPAPFLFFATVTPLLASGSHCEPPRRQETEPHFGFFVTVETRTRAQITGRCTTEAICAFSFGVGLRSAVATPPNSMRQSQITTGGRILRAIAGTLGQSGLHDGRRRLVAAAVTGYGADEVMALEGEQPATRGRRHGCRPGDVVEQSDFAEALTLDLGHEDVSVDRDLDLPCLDQVE